MRNIQSSLTMWKGENLPQSDTARNLTRLLFPQQLAFWILRTLFHLVRVVEHNLDWFIILISAVFTIIKAEAKFLHN